GPDLVGEHLERPLLEIAVLAGTLEVVGDRQQLGQHGRLGGVDRGLPVALDAAAVVGELRREPLDVRGPLVELRLQLGRGVRPRPRRLVGGVGGLSGVGPVGAGHLDSPSPSSSSTTSASTTSSSAEPEALSPASPASAPSAAEAS